MLHCQGWCSWKWYNTSLCWHCSLSSLTIGGVSWPYPKCQRSQLLSCWSCGRLMFTLICTDDQNVTGILAQEWIDCFRSQIDSNQHEEVNICPSIYLLQIVGKHVLMWRSGCCIVAAGCSAEREEQWRPETIMQWTCRTEREGRSGELANAIHSHNLNIFLTKRK